MLREDHVAGRGATPNPAREDRRDYSADPTSTETPNRNRGTVQGLSDLLEATAPKGALRPQGGRTAQVTDIRAYRETVTPAPEVAAAMERASELDKAWFEDHPDRAHRVRRLVPDEPMVDDTPPPGVEGLPVYVVVRQVSPGLRVKAAFWGAGRPCDCEECAADLWLKFAPPQGQSFAIKAAALVLGSAS